MIFVDSNIPMYLVGADHPHKHDAERLVGEPSLGASAFSLEVPGAPGLDRCRLGQGGGVTLAVLRHLPCRPCRDHSTVPLAQRCIVP